MAGFLTDGVAQGPLPLTGNETENMDTNLPSGQNPQVGAYTPTQKASGVSAIVTGLTTGLTTVIPATVNTMILDSTSATLAAETVTLSPAFDGQKQGFVFPRSAVTSLTINTGMLNGATPTIYGAPTTTVAGTVINFILKAVNGVFAWYKG